MSSSRSNTFENVLTVFFCLHLGRKKKTVVVTGTSTGIGEETAKLLAKKGWIVFAGVRKQADADRLQSHDTNIRPLILDVTKQDQIDAAFEQVRTAVGEDGLDALVNNAGLAIMGPAEFTSLNDVHKQYDINVYGMIRVTQAAMPLLRTGPPGRVVNVSSIAPLMSAPFGGLYCATKAAVDSFSECFRMEVAKWGIKVSVLKPGPVKTAFGDTALDFMKQIKDQFGEGSKCWEYYKPLLESYEKQSKSFEKSSALPTSSSAVIYRALSAGSPKYIYYDTWKTYFIAKILAWMPRSWYYKAINSMLK